MSQPKRLNAFLQDDADGIYCFYYDYAALAAENERLRRAGDDLAMFAAKHLADNYGSGTEKEALEYINGKTYQDTFSEFVDWLAAKEGRGAK